MEGQYAIRYNTSLNLSTQQLVDCAGNFAAFLKGCRGGAPYLGLLYANFTGIERDSDYPYVAMDEKCTENVTSFIKFPMKEVIVIRNNETILQKALGKFYP